MTVVSQFGTFPASVRNGVRYFADRFLSVQFRHCRMMGANASYWRGGW